MIWRSVGAWPVTSPTTSATEASPQLSSSDCCCQYLAAASGSPYTPLALVLVVAGALPGVLPIAEAGDPGNEVAARTDGGAGPHPDTNEMLAVPTQAATKAVRTAVAIPELNILFARPVGQSIGLQTSTYSKR
jgi:hypothetical protein